MAGCGDKAVYDNVQYNKRQQCNQVSAPDYEECINRANKSYETYKREREAVIQND